MYNLTQGQKTHVEENILIIIRTVLKTTINKISKSGDEAHVQGLDIQPS